MPIRDNGIGRRLARAASSLHPLVLLHPFRMLHYWGYSHVLPRRRMTTGRDVRIAPTASFRNGERIALGDQVQLGEGVALWAGRSEAWIRIGDRTTFGPGAFVTAADYGLAGGARLTDQEMVERDVTVGADCWIGAKAIITAGVVLGDGCVIGAGAVVTRDVPAGAVAVGVPARVVRLREGASRDAPSAPAAASIPPGAS